MTMRSVLRHLKLSRGITSTASRLFSSAKDKTRGLPNATQELPNSHVETTNGQSESSFREPENATQELSPTDRKAKIEKKVSPYSVVLKEFPDGEDGVQMVFAYGSGVFQQEGHGDKNKNMLDFVMVVDDPKDWHRKNIQMNKVHYSSLKYLGSGTVTWIQECGAGLYFNTLVPYKDRLMKYGVISTERLLDDLMFWNELYITGRLHKPVHFVKYPESDDIQFYLHANLVHAANVATFFLPEKFSELDLYVAITGLSYTGDVRMGVGEDKNKVRNIVHPNIEKFRDLYSEIIEKDPLLYFNDQTGNLEQDCSQPARLHRIKDLPKAVLEGSLEEYLRYNKDHVYLDRGQIYFGPRYDIELKMEQLSEDERSPEMIRNVVEKIVYSSSLRQTGASMISAGGAKSVRYGFRKFMKWAGSMMK